jgi:hypothetical protein
LNSLTASKPFGYFFVTFLNDKLAIASSLINFLPDFNQSM